MNCKSGFKAVCATALAAVLFIFLLTGCDPACFTEINIDNQSSYDLRLNFKHDYYKASGRRDFEVDFQETVDVAKNTIGSFDMKGFDFDETDPNKHVQKIIFLNLSDQSTLKEVENDGLFIVAKKEKMLCGIAGRSESSYLLKITDGLLQDY